LAKEIFYGMTMQTGTAAISERELGSTGGDEKPVVFFPSGIGGS
jgi:hypothetical protein